MRAIVQPRVTAVLAALLLLWWTASSASARQTGTLSAELSVNALPAGQTAVLAVIVDVPPGLHVQSHTPLDPNLIKFEVSADPAPGINFLPPVYPKATLTTFPGLGQESIYTGRVVAYIPLRVHADARPGTIQLTGKATWQACNDRVCFRPEMDRPFSVPTSIALASTPVKSVDPGLFAGLDQSVFASASQPTATATAIDFFGRSFSLGSSSIGLALLLALAVGVLFNLMPCVLPVVPLKAIGFFEVSRHDRARCFLLGVVFSLGILAVFAALAVLIVGVRHFSWGQQFQQGWFIWTMVAILTVMALGMFGLFEVVLPDAVYSITPSHESIWGNFLFGILAALLSTPCTAPMFAGLIAWSLAAPLWLGVAMMITVGVGMALPYLLLSAAPNLARRVPRTGPWSLVLKQMMGFLLLASAVFFAGGRLASDRSFIWWVFGVIAAAMVFLVVRTIQLSHRAWPVLASVVAAAVVIGASLSVTRHLGDASDGLPWKRYTPDAFAAARASGRPVLVEFTANWCSNCLALEASVFHDRAAAQAIKKDAVVLLRADCTTGDAPGWSMVNQLNPGGGIPLTAIYGPGQNEPIKLTSLYTTQNLIDALGRAKS